MLYKQDSLTLTLPLKQPVIRLYAVPLTAFTAEEEDDEGAFDGEEPESAGGA